MTDEPKQLAEGAEKFGAWMFTVGVVAGFLTHAVLVWTGAL